MPSRDEIIAAARGWIGTPYRHQASLQGVGCDCLGLVRGVWRGCIGGEPEALPAYSQDWAEAGAGETLLHAALRHLVPLALDEAGAGDVLLFRWRARLPAKHAGLLTARRTMVHAHEGAAVCEIHLSDWWLRHRAAAFAFPGVTG